MIILHMEPGRNNRGRSNLLDKSTLRDVPFDSPISVCRYVVHLNGCLIFTHSIKYIYMYQRYCIGTICSQIIVGELRKYANIWEFYTDILIIV